MPGKSGLAEAAARYLYKLMAYKDEYEVARLHTDPAFLAQLDAQFKHGYTVKYNLAPPTISKRDPVTGELHEAAVRPLDAERVRLLAKFKGLRGGALDIFGKTEERRHERQMIEDYIKELDEICAKLERRQPRRGGGAGQRARRDPRLRPREGEEHRRGEGPARAAAAGLPQPAAGRSWPPEDDGCRACSTCPPGPPHR